jgi:hypothetical protein
MDKASLAIRLADATPWVLLDVACLAALCFLVSRVWAAAAPRLGRKLSRLLLWVAMPVGLLTSVASHAAAPEKAKGLSNALDSTAFSVSVALSLWWLGVLAVRSVRHLLRRPSREAAVRQPLAEWLRLGLASVPLAALVMLIQWDLSGDETKALGARAEATKKLLGALEVVDRRREEFGRERELIAAKLETLRRIVPPSHATQEFVNEVTALASTHGIEVREWRSSAGGVNGILREHLLVLEVAGDMESLVALAGRSEKMARLSAWQRANVQGGNALVEVTLYSAPDPPAKRPDDWCALRASEVWLWPYTAKVAAARLQLERLCGDVVRYAAVKREVDDVELKRARLQSLVDAIVKVTASRVPLKMIRDDAPRRAIAPLRRKEARRAPSDAVRPHREAVGLPFAPAGASAW